MKRYIMAIDQGTTSTRAILFDRRGNLKYSAQREVMCLYPKPGWVEEEPLKILISMIDVINDVLITANTTLDEVDSIGLTNQRETTIIWEKKTGLPVYNAIVWQSKQSQAICDSLNEYKHMIHQKTGLLINPYFSASKIRFILDAIPNGQERAERGELLFGTVDSWLIYKATKGKMHATDVSNASRTLLYNINAKEWDSELLSLFNIPQCLLPTVKPSSYDYGKLAILDSDVHIMGVAGDQQAALFGQACFDKGESKNTYGTGCFALMNIGEKPVFSQRGLLTTIAWEINGKTTYALEGSVFIGGAVVQWLRDEMYMIRDADESEHVAKKVSDSGGVYVVPAFVGLGTPYWDNDARGAVFGLTRGSSRAHFVRACLESIAYQSKDVLEVMKKEAHLKLKSLRVDGGATKNNLLLQFQADILRCKIILPQCMETTALGVAYLSGLRSGFWKNMSEIKMFHCNEKTFVPEMESGLAKSKCSGWKKAIRATRTFKN